MTKENCERLLAHYEKAQNDSSLSEQARLNAKVALADMKNNIAKYRPDMLKKKK